MSMFFGKNKEKDDAAQTMEIKDASTQTDNFATSSNPTITSTPANPFKMSNETETDMPMQENPFAQPMQTMSPNTTPGSTTNPNPFAMKNSDSKESSATNPTVGTNMQTSPASNQPTDATNSFGSSSQNQSNPFGAQTNPQNDLGVLGMENSSASREEIQEIIDETVEKVIEERWTLLVENVEKVVKWKENVEQEMNLIKEDIVQIKKGFENLEKKIIGKINSYDANILDVNSEIKALEKVFQKITPTLINNVNQLSKIADKLNAGDSKENGKMNASGMQTLDDTI